MPSDQNIRILISKHEQRLQKLREQQALQGIETPAAVLVEIEEIEKIIAGLKTGLQETDERSALDYLTEISLKISHPLLRASVVILGVLTFVFLLALLIGIPIQQLTGYSSLLIILFLPMLALIYVVGRGSRISLPRERGTHFNVDRLEEFYPFGNNDLKLIQNNNFPGRVDFGGSPMDN